MPDKTGAELIAAERERQVRVEGWTPGHDDEHTHGELACAGAVYAMPANGSWKASEWPFEPESIKHDWRSREGRIRELARAGALIAAEIDRLQRLEDSDASKTDVCEKCGGEGLVDINNKGSVETHPCPNGCSQEDSDV